MKQSSHRSTESYFDITVWLLDVSDIDMEFLERFPDFNVFRERFGTFDEFRKPFEQKDIGLHRAVARAIDAFIAESKFPSDIHHQDEEIRHVFRSIDSADISIRKLANPQRDRQTAKTGDTYTNLKRRWSRAPEKLKSPPADDTEALIVFYYFTHFVQDLNARPRDRFWHIVLRNLEPEGSISAKRTAHHTEDRDKNGDKHLGDYTPVRNVERTTQRGNRVIPSAPYKAARTPTDVLIDIRQMLIGDKEMVEFFYRLDYSEREGAFRFDPKTFRRSDDERRLDNILWSLSIAGGMLRRGEINPQDTHFFRSHVEVVMAHPEVNAYLTWLQSENEVPRHVDYIDAVFLFETLTDTQVPALTQYRRNTENTLADDVNKAKGRPDKSD